MKKTVLLFLLTAFGAPLFTATAQTASSNRITQAVFDVYDKLLREDPDDYETWFRRANEYYRHNEYMRALNDVDQALRLIPADNNDMREQAYMLRANIYQQTGRTRQALDDLNSALAISPNSYVAIYQRANANYELGDYTAAKADYQRLQRVNPRSAEALIGLARIAVRENNLGLASEYLENAVAADPNNADLYVRRASVRRLMGNDRSAVDDLILALSTDSHNSRATKDLVSIANDNYPAVIEALTDAMRQAPNVGMFVYLRAFIAQAHHRYTAALTDYRDIIDRQLYNYHGIYASMAECQYALGFYDQALDLVEKAISMDRNNASHQILKSQILRALKRFDEAKTAAAAALAIKTSDLSALSQLALCYVSLENYREAANLFGEAALDNPDNFMIALNRAWLLGTYLNEPVASEGFYKKVIELSADNLKDVSNMRGFALLYSGKTEEALGWADAIASSAKDPDGYIHYILTCLYSAAGQTDKAFDAMELSLKNGYANYHNWTENTDSRINVSAIRDDLRFIQLLDRYKIIFGR